MIFCKSIAVTFEKIEPNRWETAHHTAILASSGSKNIARILSVNSSLTRFLEKQYHMPLQLVLQEQFVHCFNKDEAQLLQCKEGQPCLRRQVSLAHQGITMFDAESVLPLEDLSVTLMSDLQNGEIPLGHLLSNCGLSLSRSDLSFSQVMCHQQQRWARRSILRSFSGASALVSEYFCPEMWAWIQKNTPKT
ncbi:MAG: chorismate lyase [Mariprofundaceae bacterium]|nr:chorismate lyase [Mariprofundaceae bacterium]